jgi:hypothetical protein
MRTIVLSDVHGNMERLERIIEHSRYERNADQLIFAGDAADIGPYATECMQRMIDLGAKFISGNHDVAHLLKQEFIMPYDDNLDLTTDFRDTWEKVFREQGISFIVNVDGIIISHAGISNVLYKRYGRNIQKINEDMIQAFEVRDKYNDLFYSDLYSPIWFRPYGSYYMNDEGIPAPIIQMVGHTPYHALTKEALNDKNLFFIDGYAKDGSIKYGLIENGVPSVITFIPKKPIPLYKFR